MNTMFRSTLGLAAALLISVAVQAADLGAGAFSIGVAKGDVTYSLAGSDVYQPAPAGTALPQGAILKTGADSEATVVFSSGSVATLGADSILEVSKFQQVPFTGTLVSGEEPSVSDTQLKLVQGEVISKVSKLRKGSQYVVNSPIGAAGVRGTIFLVNINSSGRGSIEVTEGSVVLNFSDGSSVLIQAGFGWNSTTRQVYALSPSRIASINARAATDNRIYTDEKGEVPNIPLTDLIGVSIN